MISRKRKLVTFIPDNLDKISIKVLTHIYEVVIEISPDYELSSYFSFKYYITNSNLK